MSIKRMIQSVETHSGEPMRVITGGVPYIPGNSVYEQMKWLEQNDDQLDLVPEGGRDITRVGALIMWAAQGPAAGGASGLPRSRDHHCSSPGPRRTRMPTGGTPFCRQWTH